MNLVLDSSVWIEEFADGPRWPNARKAIPTGASIFVPTIVIFEVYRRVAKLTSKQLGLSVVAHMTQNETVELSQRIALAAANLSIEHKISMADSIVLASARSKKATLLTLDRDFEGIPGARVF